MKKLISGASIGLSTIVLLAASASAQSSGNFSATATAAACAIGAGGTFSGGTGVPLFSSNISPSNGSGVTLDIRPSLVTGLFLVLGTLSARNFDFIVPVGQGKHTVEATWSVIGAGASGGNASVASCVGPGILTVTQEKVFNNSGALLTF